jgi:HTH-type transcriptional regulator/antitoxin HigA
MKYKKISNINEYTDYCNRYEFLVNQNYEKNKDEIELLEILISEYDNRVNPINRKLNPVELLESFLKEEQISNAQLAEDIGVSKQLISDILKYRRNISKEMVNKLANYFKLRPEAFSRPYKLKNKTKEAV